MPAPTNQPVVTSVPLAGKNRYLGLVTHNYQPTRIPTYQATIPTVLLGNEVQAGYACFTLDGINVTKGSAAITSVTQLVGFAVAKEFNEFDIGSLNQQQTVNSQFLVPSMAMGSMYVATSGAINPVNLSTGEDLMIVTSTTGATPGYVVGSVFQGSSTALPTGLTAVVITGYATIKEVVPSTLPANGIAEIYLSLAI